MTTLTFIPGYVKLYESGKLENRIQKARELLKNCAVCPRLCYKNRLKGELGTCKIGEKAFVYGFGPHYGEERPLVGSSGSGTIFFSSCNLRCVFCQNYEISHLRQGYPVEDSELANIMLRLQNMGCHNINFVTPTHIVPQILKALPEAIEKGLKIPLVYNSSGYDRVETLKLLDGIIDIYMPDYKYSDTKSAQRFSKVVFYPKTAQEAIQEMHRQVGDLVLDENGLAQRGLIVRHLILPDNLAGSFQVLDFLAQKISLNTYLNLMDQYHPCFKASLYPEVNRPITQTEFMQVVNYAKKLGFKRLD